MTDFKHNPGDLNRLIRPKQVCLCNFVNEKQIIDAIQSGCHTLAAISDKTQACTNCQNCKHSILNILKRELKQ